jgi:hypothetical protein
MWALIDSYFHIACHRVYISHQDILECQDQFGNVQSRRLQYGKPSGRLEVQSVHLSLELPFTRQGHLEGALEPALLATFLHLCPVEGKEGWWLEGSIPQCTLAPCHSFGPVNLSESWGWGTLPPCLWVDSEPPPTSVSGWDHLRLSSFVSLGREAYFQLHASHFLSPSLSMLRVLRTALPFLLPVFIYWIWTGELISHKALEVVFIEQQGWDSIPRWAWSGIGWVQTSNFRW